MVDNPATEADSDVVPEAELGARRRRPRSVTERVRVELRIPAPVAAMLYRAAGERGQSVSRVGTDAIKAYFEGGDR